MLILYLYVIISYLVYPLLLPLIPLFGLYKNDEHLLRFKERLGIPTQKKPLLPIIWLDAESVGELNAIIPFIREYNKIFPQQHFLVTTNTLNSFTVFTNANLSKAIHQYSPIDCPQILNKFLSYWKPTSIIISESKISPNYFIHAMKYGRIFMINARMSDKSFARWKRVKSAINYLLKRCTSILPSTKYDLCKFEFFDLKNLGQVCNLKEAARPIQHSPWLLKQLKSTIGQRKVLIYTNTHPGEEKIALNAHRLLKPSFPDLLTVIAPRYISRIGDINLIASRNQLTTSLFSLTQGVVSQNDDIYLVDTIGMLGTFYKIAEIAFVGGSLVELGGHNVLEPVKLGLAVVVGPHTFSSKETIENLTRANAIVVVQNAAELVASIKNLLENNNDLRQIQANAAQYVQSRTASISAIVNHILSYH